MPTSRLSDALGHAPADKRIDILRAVVLTGSISQAARDTAVSYKAAWQALDTLTNLAGVALVERVVGGAGGGGAVVTAAGIELLALADALNAARRHVLAARTSSIGLLSGASLGLRTSMRNQWPCDVVRVEHSGATARIHLQLGSGSHTATLVARVTQESAELLALQPGQPVLALCKATAVKITAVAVPEAMSVHRVRNTFEGTTMHIAPGGASDEIALQLASTLHVIGFAPTGAVPGVGSRAVATIAENAVVIALAD
jgi:molybdate transport system regulatory protein